MIGTILRKIRFYLIIILALVILDRITAPPNTEALVAYAVARVQEADKLVPPKTFEQDGCTLFPEKLLGSDWSQACLMHDIAYWVGGNDAERKIADAKLRDGVRDSGVIGRILAPFVYINVRMAGDSWLTELFDAHWGFGWDV